MDLHRIRTTTRDLVRAELGSRRINPSTVVSAYARANQRGYLMAHVPRLGRYDEPIVLVRADSPFAPLYRALLLGGGTAEVPRGAVESRAGLPLALIPTGLLLARFSIALLAVDGFRVRLRAAPLRLAHLVNPARYDPEPREIETKRLLEEVGGVSATTAMPDDDERLRAALVYDEYAIDVDGLLDGRPTTEFVSRWRFPPCPASSEQPPF